ncbi:MAG: glycosyltransferase [Nitrospiraceae bacterium]
MASRSTMRDAGFPRRSPGYRFRSLTIFAIPTIEGDTISTGAHAGLAIGLPVVSTTTRSIPTWSRTGIGLIVPPRDAEALADRIGLLLDDPSRCASLGREGRLTVERCYSRDRSTNSSVSTGVSRTPRNPLNSDD